MLSYAPLRRYAALRCPMLPYARRCYPTLSYAPLLSFALPYAPLRCPMLPCVHLRSATVLYAPLGSLRSPLPTLPYAALRSSILPHAALHRTLSYAALRSSTLPYDELRSSTLAYSALRTPYAPIHYPTLLPYAPRYFPGNPSTPYAPRDALCYPTLALTALRPPTPSYTPYVFYNILAYP